MDAPRDQMTVDLQFLASQIERVITDVGRLRARCVTQRDLPLWRRTVRSAQ
jgi:hypothetical protein